MRFKYVRDFLTGRSEVIAYFYFRYNVDNLRLITIHILEQTDAKLNSFNVIIN